MRCFRFQLRFARAWRGRVGNVTYAIALALVADAVGGLDVVGVKLRAAERNRHDLIELVAPWVKRGKRIIHRLPAQSAG